ncbi:MAG TPA: preprotein translocase subunit YajC [Spirochaetales bacterium]|nr:preprotein translocase subunit YajC [Spirochaetales bacterium]
MISTIVTFGLVFVVFYFLIIRPQNKKQKEAQKMINQMKKGDKVVTIGGIHGVIQTVKEQTVVVKVDNDVFLEFSKSAVSAVTPKAEEKSEVEKSETSADSKAEDKPESKKAEDKPENGKKK